MDFKINFNNFENAMNAVKIFELRKRTATSVLEGKCKDARIAQKELAKIAVEDFDTYTKMPNIQFTGFPLKLFLPIIFKTMKFKIFRLFTKKIPEEKQLVKMYKEYQKGLTPEDIKQKTLKIDASQWF